MRLWPPLSLRFLRDEAGSGSVLPMLILTAILAVGGFASDTASLWRQGEVMRATADAAAHAGAVALARGNSAADALAIAEQAIALNMNPAIFAPGRNKPRSDLVRLWHYNATSGDLSEDGAPNAVSVQLRRSEDDANSVPLYLLGLVGLGDVTARTTAVVALTPSSRCANASGIYARGELALEGEAEVGSGFCLHSQQSIDLARQVKFAEGAHLSVPNLLHCDGNCSETFSPGFTTAAGEANLISQNLRARMSDLASAMLGQMQDSDLKSGFFSTRPIAEDLEALAELDIDVSGLRTGSVLRMAAWDFEALREVPAGLVYAVSCDPNSPEGPPILEVGGGVSAPVVNNVVILTNCALHFPDDIEVTGSLILTSYDGNLPAITADPFAVVGDPSVTCDPQALTQVMALGDQVLPASLLLSNVALVVDGNATVQAGEGAGPAQHHGFALHASGAVTFQGNHSFAACDQGYVASLPSLDVLRYVMPKVPAQPQSVGNPAEMPGTEANPLPSIPPLPMSKTPPRLPSAILSQADLPLSEVGL